MKRFLDPLYGEVALPSEVWEVSKAPEVQRLREVRMCNINSLALTGAGGVHRFEHSLGTAWLAQENADAGRSRFEGDDRRTLMLAALLHDVGSAGFGHSVEYILKDEGFRHDDLMAFSQDQKSELGYEYKIADLEPIFFGQARTLHHLLDDSELRRISSLVGGSGRLGPLISGSIDLDNIDNVYRLAYHMGLWSGGSAPVDLARALSVDDAGLRIDAAQVDLLDHWRSVRAELYTWLLLDEDEFAAKAMLERALHSAHVHSGRSFRWRDVDYELMLKLRDSTPEASELAGRIMTGNLFGTLTVLETTSGSIPTPSWSSRDKLETMLSEVSRRLRAGWGSRLRFALHFIQDVNKTDREIHARTSTGEMVNFGSRVDRTLIGVMTRNKGFSADSPGLQNMRDVGLDVAIATELSSILGVELRAVQAPNSPASGRLDFFV